MSKKIRTLAIKVNVNTETGKINIENKSKWGDKKVETAFMLFMAKQVNGFFIKSGMAS